MNISANTPDTAQKTSDNGAPARNYRPRLSFYHANGKGSGSAAQFEVVPACGDRDGAVFLALAQQKSVASGSAEQGNRQHATFDWPNRITVKLNFSDLCQLLQVFKGVTATVADGKGLYHDSRNTTTLIHLARQNEPYAGFALEVSRKEKNEPDSAARVRIVFTPPESFGLGAVLEQVLGWIAFGVPNEAAGSTSPARTEAEPATL